MGLRSPPRVFANRLSLLAASGQLPVATENWFGRATPLSFSSVCAGFRMQHPYASTLRTSGRLTGCTPVLAGARDPRLVYLIPVASIWLAACGAGVSTNPGIASSTSPPVTSSSVEVVVMNYTFPAISVKPGVTIRLVDRDDEPHTVTANDGTFKADPFNTKTLQR